MAICYTYIYVFDNIVPVWIISIHWKYELWLTRNTT